MTDISRYQLNHPKAYLGYTVALAKGGDKQSADELTEEYVTGGPDMARRGAQNLGLVEQTDDGYQPTGWGDLLVLDLQYTFDTDSNQDVLEEFDELRGARTRFIEQFPDLRTLCAEIGMGDPMISSLVSLIHGIQRDRITSDEPMELSTVELFDATWERDRATAANLFVRDDDDVRDAIFDQFEVADQTPLLDNETSDGASPVYVSSTTYQLKTICWHLGLLQQNGTQASNLDPLEQTWSAEPDLTNFVDIEGAPFDGEE